MKVTLFRQGYDVCTAMLEYPPSAHRAPLVLWEPSRDELMARVAAAIKDYKGPVLLPADSEGP